MNAYASQSIKLVAIDIDGTLLGPDGKPSPENLHAVEKLKASGREVILASGRSHANMLPFHKLLGLNTPLVSVHGAVVRDSQGALHGATSLPMNVMRELTLLGREHGVAVLHYREHGIFLELENEMTRFDQSRNSEPQLVVDDLLATDEPAHKVMWLSTPETIQNLQPKIEQIATGSADLIATDPGYLEFISSGVSKAVGVGMVANQRNLTPAEVATFGDGNNDAPMLAWAGLGVAMNHATPSAKEAARVVAPAGPESTCLARAISLVFHL